MPPEISMPRYASLEVHCPHCGDSIITTARVNSVRMLEHTEGMSGVAIDFKPNKAFHVCSMKDN